MLGTSGLVLPASGESVFLPDTSLLCISIPNSDCLFPLSFDQVVKRPSRPNPGPAGPIRARDLTVTAHQPNQNPAYGTKGNWEKEYKADTAAKRSGALPVASSTAGVPKGHCWTQRAPLLDHKLRSWQWAVLAFVLDRGLRQWHSAVLGSVLDSLAVGRPGLRP